MNLIKNIWRHPANKQSRLSAVMRAILFQTRMRMTGRPYDFSYHGFKLRCHANSHSASRGLYFSGMPDYWEMCFIRDYLRPGDCFVDVGANVGLYSLLARSIVGEAGQVHAFEPAPETANRLQEIIELNKLDNMTLHRLALSERSESVTFNLTSEDCTAHISPNFKSDFYAVNVDAVRLDEYMPDENITMMKLDVEGHEPFAIRGATNLLTAGNPAVMQVEMAGYSKEFGVTTTQAISELEEIGYQTMYYEPDSRTLIPTKKPYEIPIDNVLAVFLDKKNEVIDRIQNSAD